MIFTKKLSKAGALKHLKRPQLFKVLRSKYPKLAERIGNTWLGTIIPTIIEERDFLKAVKTVETLFEISIPKKPMLLFFKRQVVPDLGSTRVHMEDLEPHFEEYRTHFPQEDLITSKSLEGKRFYVLYELMLFGLSSSLFLRHRMDYIQPLEAINIPFLRNLFLPRYQRHAYYAHELVHHTIPKNSPLRFHQLFGPSLERSIATICEEGLAKFAERKQKREPKDTYDQAVEGFRAFIEHRPYLKELIRPYSIYSPLVFFIKSLTKLSKLLSMFLRENNTCTQNFIQKVEKGSWFAKLAVDPYEDGYNFIKGLHDLKLSAHQIFKLVTTNLPTFREIFYPSEYLGRMYREEKL